MNKINISAMSAYLNARDIKEHVSLTDLLGQLGFQPVRKSGRELIYRSMLRDNDTNPSMSVNEQLGVWFDHGTGKGGNIIDFGLAYWRGLAFEQVLEKIHTLSGAGIAAEPLGRPLRPRLAVRVPHYVVSQVLEISEKSAIAGYLRQRGILGQAKEKLKEVHYYVENPKGIRKQFFAAGWPNETGGWEVRNKFFKGCLGHKGITFHPGDENQVAVFEGYLNYLSWLKDNPGASQSVLVLNSTALLGSGIAKSRSFSSVDLYLDNDAAGVAATKEFIAAVPHALDRSDVYAGYNDYNEMSQPLQNEMSIKR